MNAEKRSLLIHPEELSDTWVRRARELKLSSLALHPAGGAKAAETLASLLEDLKTDAFRARIDALLEEGVAVEYECHAAGYLLPRSLFAAHPEYFRKNAAGERSPDFNFCVSSPEALSLVCENAAKLMKGLYRNTHRYFFWLDDTKDGFCHCEKCQKLSPSDQQMLVLNAMLRRMRREDPEATLAYLAYQETLPCPETVPPEEGIFLEYAPIERDPNTPLAQTEGVRERILPLLGCFGKKGAKVLEYWFDNSLYSKWKKPPVFFSAKEALIRSDRAFYLSLGFEENSSFACYLGKDYADLYGEADFSSFL